MVEQRDIKFPVEGGNCLRGWLFLPPRGAEPLPAISVAHGYAGVKEQGLERFAQAPRSWAEKAYPKLIHYNKLPKGGHFAAWEQPEIFVSEMRASFKMLRKPI
jgi:hypothetical protein